MNQVKKAWPLIIFLAALILFLVFQWKKYRVAPEIRVFSLPYTDTSGKNVSLERVKGKKVIFSFFATWCGDCLSELSQLNDAKKSGYEGIPVIAISEEAPEKISSFARRKKYDFTFLRSGTSFSALQVNAIPVTYVFDSKGELIFKKVGAVNWRDASLKKMIENSE